MNRFTQLSLIPLLLLISLAVWGKSSQEDAPLQYFQLVFPDKEAVLKWATPPGVSLERFIIQRSADGLAYDNIGEIAAADNAHQMHQYSFPDKNWIGARMNYYRLKIIEPNGQYSYSELLTFDPVEAITGNRLLYPNPIQDGTARIKYPFPHRGTASIRMYDLAGREVVRKMLNVAAKDWEIRWAVDHLPKGLYSVKALIRSRNQVHMVSEKVLIE
ncbi:MAG: T9SS type A sorting domain-containing protein [Bacteroidota bacterium]